MSDAELESSPGPTPRRSLVWLTLAVAAVVIVLDRLTKWWAVAELKPRQQPIDVIGTFLQFRYVENTGAAFGIGTGITWVFTGIAIIVAIVIIRTSRKIGSVAWAVAFGMLLGGAVGNLIDRLVNPPSPGMGYVVDFISMPPFQVFNLADASIVCSAVLMVILALRGSDYRGSVVETPTPAAPTS
jgi:signal peptidase II